MSAVGVVSVLILVAAVIWAAVKYIPGLSGKAKAEEAVVEDAVKNAVNTAEAGVKNVVSQVKQVL